MSLIKPSWHSSAEWYLDSPTSRHTSGLTPLFLRELAAAGGLNESSLPSLEHPEGVAALTVTQARSLRGPQIDGIIKKKLADVLGTKWLMQAQECWYRPERPVEAGGRNGSSTSSPLHGAGGTGEAHTRDYGKPDIAMLMVDNRPPFAYEVPGTSLRSPDGWGAKRTHITASWRPTEPSTSIFQMALVINHIYAQLHGYRFYLENPCPHVRIGVRKEDWESSVTPKQLVQPKSEWREAMANYTRTDPVCPGLPASHRLGPFPPRGPPWIKIAALRYLLRRHQYIIYLDSDCFVTEVWQPITPLLQSTGLLDGSRWIAAAEEFPPQKLRGDFRAGIANSGVLLLTGAPIAGAKILQSVEEWIWPMGNPTWMFKWPFEQNALTQVVFRRNPERYTLLKPGCPINSPFGALLRHMVGGTPHRAIYHPDHRLPWLVDALQCTLRATNHSGSPAAPPLERCTPNERSLRLDASGCDETEVLKDTTPIAPRVFSRMRAADWEACCSFCNLEARCVGWTYAWRWPYMSRNCMLLEGFSGLKNMKDRVTQVRRTGAPSRPVVSYKVNAPLLLATGPDVKEIGSRVQRAMTSTRLAARRDLHQELGC